MLNIKKEFVHLETATRMRPLFPHTLRLLWLLFCLPSFAAHAQTLPPPPGPSDVDVIVCFPDTTSPTEIDSLRTSYGAIELDTTQTFNCRYWRIGPAGFDGGGFPYYIVGGEQTNAQGVTPIIRTQTVASENYPVDSISAPECYQCLDTLFAQSALPLGQCPVKVAIIDSGVRDGHPSFPLGQIVDAHDCLTKSSTPPIPDNFGHGTPVTGVAFRYDQIPLTNPASAKIPNIQYYDIKALNNLGKGTVWWMMLGLDEANLRGVDIANISSGYAAERVPPNSTPVEFAINAVGEDGMLVVVAAGNEGLDIDNSTLGRYPAGFSLPNLLSVASVGCTSPLSLSYFSNYGQTVDLAARGEYVWTTLVGGGWGRKSGTSFAAPAVTGLAALLVSNDCNISPYALRDIILQSAMSSPLPIGQRGEILNPQSAFQLLMSGGGSGTVFVANATSISPGSIALSWSAVSGATGYQLFKKTTASGTFALLATLPAGTTSFSHTGLAAGMGYYYMVSAMNGASIMQESNWVCAATPSYCTASLALNGAPVVADDYYAQMIYSSGKIEPNCTGTRFQAGQEVQLLPGFHAQQGSVFTAQITTCPTQQPPAPKSAVMPSMQMELAPNPASNTAFFRYYLPEPSLVSLSLFTIDGRPVRTLMKVSQNSGWQEGTLKLEDLPNGMYYLHLGTDKEQLSKKLIILR
jgi:hypothetical protein